MSTTSVGPPNDTRECILTLSCPDRIGIVHAVSSFFVERACYIVASQQFGDPQSRRFFMRVHFAVESHRVSMVALRADSESLGPQWGMSWEIQNARGRSRVLIMVSRLGHCLNDLLFRCRSGSLAADVVVRRLQSSRPAPLVLSHGVPFHHLPVTPRNQAAPRGSPARTSRRVAQCRLGGARRYTQVLSDDLCAALAGRAINIHHSFLPSFKGARLYCRIPERSSYT